MLLLTGSTIEFIWSHRKIWHKSYYLGKETNKSPSGNVNNAFTVEEAVPHKMVDTNQSKDTTNDSQTEEVAVAAQENGVPSLSEIDTNEANEYKSDCQKDENAKSGVKLSTCAVTGTPEGFVPFVAETNDKYSYPVPELNDDKHKYCQRGIVSTMEKTSSQRKDGKDEACIFFLFHIEFCIHVFVLII